MATAWANGPTPRIRVLIAVLIAATGVLSSVAAWRSDVADRQRSEWLKQVDYQSRERQGAVEEIDTDLNDSRVTLLRVRVNDRRARVLAEQARDPDAPADVRRRARALAAGYRAMAAVVHKRIDPDVIARGATPAAFARSRDLLLEAAEARRDLDPRPEQAKADTANQRQDDLREIGVAALIAALLLTCAEVSRSGWYRLWLATGVTAGVAVTVALLVVVT
jgi:hypothetical protein